MALDDGPMHRGCEIEDWFHNDMHLPLGLNPLHDWWDIDAPARAHGCMGAQMHGSHGPMGACVQGQLFSPHY